MKNPKPSSFTSLHTCRRTIFYRIYAIIHTCGIIALMYHHSQGKASLVKFLLLFSDIILAFMWATTTSFRLNPVHRSQYPELYIAESKRSDSEYKYPKLDVFICTADPYKEPPIMVVNTVLSVMAFDYPSDKISVYVSDDGGSSLTLFALMEAVEFSKHWLPFCNKNSLQDRSPEVYFSSNSYVWTDEANNLKIMYEEMKTRIEQAVNSGKIESQFIKSDHFRKIIDSWSNNKFNRHNHPTLIQILQTSETEIIPNLIYVSREKSKDSPHHFKAGALNTLLRVSGVMTNAPIILTLDCDMYSNDPITPVRILCYFQDSKINSGLGFIQFPQKFQGVSKNDIYACEYKRLFELNCIGFDGLMGSNYMGTGCFFNRRVFFGPPSKLINPGLDEIGPNWIADKPITAQDVLGLAYKVASCTYEDLSIWGSKIGFRYGSLVEDYFTGYNLHCEGWRSVYCNPKRAAFCGDAPKSLSDVVGQQKRWAIGLLEVAFSKYSPIIYGIKSMGLLMGLGYCQLAFWPIWSIPITIYGFLPQIGLFYGVNVFPKASDPWFWLYIFLFFGAYVQDFVDFVLEGGSFRKWWNDQRIWTIRGFSCYFFGFIEFTLKTLNLSTHGFNLTNKTNDDDEQMKRYEKEIFDFGPVSPLFLPMTTMAIVNLHAFVWGLYGLFVRGEAMVLELMLTSFAVMNCLPLYEAMVLRNDNGRLPKRVCFFGLVLAVVVSVLGYFVFK